MIFVFEQYKHVNVGNYIVPGNFIIHMSYLCSVANWCFTLLERNPDSISERMEYRTCTRTIVSVNLVCEPQENLLPVIVDTFSLHTVNNTLQTNGQYSSAGYPIPGNAFADASPGEATQDNLCASRMEDNNKLACSHCGKKFGTKGRLKRHLIVHTKERPFSCQFCDYTCAQKDNIIRHTRTHTGERPFTCDVCHKTFTENAHLRQHRVTHTGEKPYKCDQCGKKFGWKTSLIEHVRIHSGLKPYGCDNCGRMFSRARVRNQHLKLCIINTTKNSEG